MIKSTSSATTSLLTIILVMVAGNLIAGKKNISKPKSLISKKELTNYMKCRKRALKDLKSSGKKTKQAIRECQEIYPGAAVLTSCKKAALEKHKFKPKKFKKALQRCRKKYNKTVFKAKDSKPFSRSGGQLFFGGMGLNFPIAKIRKNPGNFNCDKLRTAIKSPNVDEFILFGNHPKVFKPLRMVKGQNLYKILSIKDQDRTAAFATTDYGRIYNLKKPRDLALYFPTSHCYMNRKLGRIYEALKVYYLINRKQGVVTPYFGISFYTAKSKTENKKIIKRTMKELGPGYKVQKVAKEYVYIAKEKFTTFDSEGDPFNLCRNPKHEYIALLRKRGTSKTAEYLAVANIKNLCTYGYRIAKQIKG